MGRIFVFSADFRDEKPLCGHKVFSVELTDRRQLYEQIVFSVEQTDGRPHGQNVCVFSRTD